MLSRNQLEIVTGGWVQPDEANSHYFSLITQLVEGHHWLQNNLNYTPKNGWAIDPFGLSPTMAYLLKRSGLEHMVIQRTHYEIKRHFAKLQALEFRWRQIWDTKEDTDILCHMMPFYHYDIPYTCGPDPNVCCAFDFRRMPSVSGVRCYSKQPMPVNPNNVEKLSLQLLDQYKKKAMLFKTNVLLIPLGEDFYWNDDRVWKSNVENYKKIFEFVNSQENLHAELKFGTLTDYFSALDEEIKAERFEPPSLTGSFFTYSDMNHDYWSGYFTSRPFYKGLDRDLISHLRSANILYSVMTAELKRLSSNAFESHKAVRETLMHYLIDARRHLSLFQHHDGVTGTAKDHVMVDYGQKLYEGLTKTSHIIQHGLHILTHLKDLAGNGDLKATEKSKFLSECYGRAAFDELPQYFIVPISADVPYKIITVFNPIAQQRTQLVSLHVSTHQVEVVDLSNNKLEYEVLPVFEAEAVSKSKFLLSILVKMDGLAVKNLKILPNTKTKNFVSPTIQANYKIEIEDTPFTFSSSNDSRVKIENSHLQLNFDRNGFVESVQDKESAAVNSLKIGFFSYDGGSSGIYLFRPNGPAKPMIPSLSSSWKTRVVEGRLQSFVEVVLPQAVHRVTLYNHPGLEKYSIQVTNYVDITQETDFELLMRVQTEIKSGDNLHTDLNGFQMIRRKVLRKKLPIAANHFPMTSAAYIEDKGMRMTVLSRQSQAVATMSPGAIDLLLDRRLRTDDNRGVGQGCLDNRPTLSTFKIVLESFHCEDILAANKPPMLSLLSHLSLHSLQYPLHTFSSLATNDGQLSEFHDYSLIQSPTRIACDLQLVDLPMLSVYRNVRDDNSSIPSENVGLFVHRVGFDSTLLKHETIEECEVLEEGLGQFNLEALTGSLFKPDFHHMSLTFLQQGEKRNSAEVISLSPNEIYAFLLKL